MKKALLLLMAALLLLTAACSGGLGTMTQTTKVTGKNEAWKDLIKEEEVVITFDTDTIEPVSIKLIAEGYPTDENYHPETDAKRAGMDSMTILYVEELGRYYMMIGDFLMYMNEDSMIPQPLCTKAGCMHNEAGSIAEKRACEAWFHTDNQNVVFHYNCMNGRLYAAHYSGENTLTLESLQPDGTDRREEFSHEGQENSGGSLQNQIFHRGRFYYTETESANHKEYSGKLWSYGLDMPGAEPELLYTSQNTPERSSVFTVRVYGKYLYLMETLAQRKTDEGSIYEERAGLILDLTTGEWLSQTRMHEVPEDYIYQNSFIVDGKLVTRYMPKMYRYVLDAYELANEASNEKLEEPKQDLLYVQTDLDGSNPVILEAAVEITSDKSDEPYICEWDRQAVTGNAVVLTVRDHTGSTVREVTYGEFLPEAYDPAYQKPEADLVYYAAYMPGGDKFILVSWYHVDRGDIFETLNNADYTYYVLDYADLANPDVPMREVFRYNTREYTC